MPDPNSPPNAVLAIGDRGSSLRGIPAAAMAAPGEVAVLLGYAPSGLPVTITTGSTEILDELASAFTAARARLVVAGGMVRT